MGITCGGPVLPEKDPARPEGQLFSCFEGEGLYSGPRVWLFHSAGYRGLAWDLNGLVSGERFGIAPGDHDGPMK